MAARGFRAIVSLLLLGAASFSLPGCWIVVGESFDDYVAASAPLGPYVTETRTALMGTRSYLLAHPEPMPAGLPLVFSLHGEGFTGADMRTQLALEKQATTGAVFVYTNTLPGLSFDMNTFDGRAQEGRLVSEVIATLASELRIDTKRVFLAGWDDGAIMANALGCLLGPSVVRGVGIDAGTFYPAEDRPDFSIDMDTSAASCPLPHALFVWGVADQYIPLTNGRDSRDVYLATQACSGSSAPWSVALPCITYDACTRQVVWCEIPNLDHEIWPDAGFPVGSPTSSWSIWPARISRMSWLAAHSPSATLSAT